jgi:hypothetical protein
MRFGARSRFRIAPPLSAHQWARQWQGLRRYRRAKGQLGEQICAKGMLFDYGVPVAKTPDF